MDLKELNERKNELIERAEAITNEAKLNKRAVSEAEAIEIGKISKEVEDLKAQIRALEEEEATHTIKEDNTMNNKNDRAMLDAYVRGIETRTAGEMEKGNNGAVIPTTIGDEIVKTVKEVSPIMSRAKIYNAKGTVQIPVYGTAATVGFSADFASITASGGDFTSVTLAGNQAAALTKIGKSLIRNAEFDVVSFIEEDMAENLANFIEAQVVGGSGTVSCLQSCTNTVSSASAGTISANDLVNLKGKVKDAYQRNACWIMSPAARDAVRLLKGSDGHFLFNDAPAGDFAGTIFGKPVYVSDAGKSVATGNKAIFYGDLSGVAIQLPGAIEVQVLRERFADESAVGVIGWVEFDAKIQKTQAIAALVIS